MKLESSKIELLKSKVENKMNSSKAASIMIVMGTLVGIVCIAMIVASIATRDIRVERHNTAMNEEAKEYLYSGEFDKAIEKYGEIKIDKIKSTKLAALTNLNIADAYSLKGDLVNYKKYISLTKDIKSNDPEILNRLVFTQYINGDINNALKTGEEALKISPNDEQLIKTMVAVYIASNKKDEAKKLLNSYQLDKLSAYDIAEYSKIIITLGDYKEGLNKLKDAWIINKDEYKIYDVLAQVSLYNKDKLVSYIKELQKANPEDIAYKMWLAKIYSLAPETSNDAEKLVLELKSENINGVEIKLIETAVLFNLNKSNDGDKLINEVVKDNSNDYGVLHNAGWFYLRENKLQEAMDSCKKSIELNENYPDNYAFLMPEILKRMDKASTSLAYYWTGLLKEPYNSNIVISAANYYWYTEQNTNKAVQYFKIASAINPEELEIKYNMALIYFNDKKDNEAVQTLKEIIKLKPNSVKYHRTLGTVLLTMDKAKEGIEEIRAAYKYDNNDILTLNNAGCYYVMYTDDFNKANTNLKKALEGINENTDEYTKKVIKENYNNVKSIIDKIQKGKGNESITIPDFRLLY